MTFEEFISLPIFQASLLVIKFEDVFGTYFYWEFNNSQCTLHSSKWTFRQNWLSSLYCCLKVAQHSVEIQNNVCHSDFTWNKCYLKWMLCRGSAFDSGEFNFQTSISRNFWVAENFLNFHMLKVVHVTFTKAIFLKLMLHIKI